MIFWAATAFIIALALALFWGVLRRDTIEESSGAEDVEIYRDQLREVARDEARGILNAEDAEAARVEVSRRLLEADAAARADEGLSVSRQKAAALALVSLVTIGASYGVYMSIGAPGYQDMPLQARLEAAQELRENRPLQAQAEAGLPARPAPQVDPQVEQMVVQLRQILETRTDDVRGFRLLARHEAGMGNLTAAWRAQERVVELLGADAVAQDHAALGELKVIAAGGYVSPEAEEALATALEKDPRNGTARYYTGLMFAQTGRPDVTFNLWRRLIADSREDAPWLEPIYLQIEEISALAGDPTPLDQLPRPQPATAAGGPTAADIEAAGELSMGERVDMIRGMVDQLAARLGAEGGPPEDWARLITSLGVIGNTDAAFAVYTEAARVFAEDQGALDQINAAADRAGVNPDGLEYLE